MNILEKRIFLKEKILQKEYLKSIPEDEIEKLLEKAYFQKLIKNEIIFSEGDEVCNVFFVLTGKIEIFKYTSNHNKKLICLMHEGDIFAHYEAFFPSKKYIINSLAKEKSEVACIRINEFKQKVFNSHNLSLSILRHMGHALYNGLVETTIKNSTIKLASYLLFCIKYSGYEKENKMVLKKNNSDEKLAEILSVTRETINRLLKKFEKDKLIKHEADEIIILDKDALKELAGDVESLPGFYGTNAFLERSE